jgi:hypothetical protein
LGGAEVAGPVDAQRFAAPADPAGWRVRKGAPLFPRDQPAAA